MFRSLLLVFILGLSACVSGPKDNRSQIEKLNGENYQTPGQVVGIPVLERKPIQRQFAGHVFCGQGISQYPSNRASVVLLKNDKTVASAWSGADGGYALASAIEPEAAYQIRATARCGVASRELDQKDAMGTAGADFFIK